MIKCLRLCLPVLMLLVGGLLYLLIRHPPAGGPRSQVHEFGAVRAGQDVEHTFTIRNPSSTPLRITRILVGCSCMITREEPTCIAGRSTCELPVLLKTYAKSGEVAQRVRVDFAGRDPIYLVLHGSVIRDVPDRLKFPRLKAGAGYQVEFWLTPYPGVDLAIQRLEYDQRYFDVVYTPVRDEQHGFRFTVALRPGVACGPFEKLLTIYTNDTVAAAKRIPLSGYILRHFEVEPAQVAFGVVRPREEKAEVIKVFSPYGDAVAVERIESASGHGITWEVLQNRGEPDAVNVKLRLRGGAHAGEFVNDRLYIYGRAGTTPARADVVISALIHKGA
jgi:hypothetical protein